MKPYILIGETKITVFPLILLAATYICMIYCVKSTHNPIEYYRDILKLVLTCIIFVFLGGKILFTISQKPKSLIEIMYNILYGGFVFYGGLAGGCIGLVVYCKREHKQIWEYINIEHRPIGTGNWKNRVFF